MRARSCCLALGCLALSACRPPAEEVAPPPPDSSAPTAAAPGPAEILSQGIAAAGWQTAAAPEVYSGEQIYEYMDGEGEIPVACGYQSLAVADVTGPAEAAARIELYAMGSDANAFGLYSLRREPEDERVELTHPAVVAPGQLIGWKGPYTFIVRADDPEKVEDDTLQVLAKGLEQQIGEAGALPELLRRLPADGLVPGSSRYFHGKFALDTIWFQSENPLQVSALTNGAAATYTAPAGQVLVIQYPPQAHPDAAMKAWCDLVAAVDDEAGHWITADGKAGAMLVDRTIVVVTECGGKEDLLRHFDLLGASLGTVAEAWPEE